MKAKHFLLWSVIVFPCAWGGHSWDDKVSWKEEIKEHKEAFLKWRKEQGISEEEERIALALSCEDADLIPKHPEGGKVFENVDIPYQLMHNGVKVIKDGYCGSWTTDLIYGLKGHHEPQEEKVFHEVLKYIPSQASMIEIGSYWAYYSLWFAKAIQGATNYLIEPVAIRSEVGRQNFELNDFPSFIFQGYVGHYDPQDVDGKDLPKIELDEFLRENGIDHVAIVHSDIQGAEYEMLQSAKASMEQGRIDFFFVSTHGQEIHDLCLSFLVAHQYDIIAEHSPEESFSCDGLIVGKRSGVDGPEEVEISKALLKR